MNNNTKGAIAMIFSSFSFTLMGVMVKMSGGNISVFQQVFFRNIIIAVFAAFFIKKRKEKFFGYKENRKLLFLRSTFGFLGVVTSFYATKNLYLGDAQALMKISPFIVTVLAILILKERVNRTRIIAMIIAFLGALIIVNPKFNSRLLPALSGFFGAVFGGSAYICISLLSKKERRESTFTILFLFAFWSLIYSLPLMLQDFNIPDGRTLFYLIMIGVFATLAQFLITTAYSIADASKISIFDYTSLIASAILGKLVFDENLPISSYIGMLLIMLSAYISYRTTMNELKKTSS